MRGRSLGEVESTITLAHQIEAMARHPKRLPELGTLLKNIRKSAKPRSIEDQHAAVAAHLERLAARQKRKEGTEHGG